MVYLISINVFFHLVNVEYGNVAGFGFAQGYGPVLLGYFSCNGNEANLSECTSNFFYTNFYCQNRHYYDAAIICES